MDMEHVRVRFLAASEADALRTALKPLESSARDRSSRQRTTRTRRQETGLHLQTKARDSVRSFCRKLGTGQMVSNDSRCFAVSRTVFDDPLLHVENLARHTVRLGEGTETEREVDHSHGQYCFWEWLHCCPAAPSRREFDPVRANRFPNLAAPTKTDARPRSKERRPVTQHQEIRRDVLSLHIFRDGQV